MPEKLEEIMKKIHVLLANCEKIAYSAEDVIVPKKQLFSLLEQLNYVVYEIMEQYEVTLAARNRALLQEENKAKEIQEDARLRAEEVYAASLLYTEDMLQEMKLMTDMMYRKTKDAYDELMQNYEERMEYLRQNEDELLLQMEAMAESKIYFQIIREKQKEKEAALKREEERKKEAKKQKLAHKMAKIEMVDIEENSRQEQLEEAESESTKVESEKTKEKEVPIVKQQVSTEQETIKETKQPDELTLNLEEEKIEKKSQKKKQPPAPKRECVGEVIDEGIDEYTAKLSSQLVITVHERPQVPEGFTKKKDKRAIKVKPEVSDEEIEIAPEEIVDYNEIPEIPQFSTGDLDKEYFEWQESKERTGEKIAQGKVKGQKLLARWKK